MKILMVSSEASPFAKTGGLGDVLGALPAALARLGDDVAVVIPKYRSVVLDNARRLPHTLYLIVGALTFTARIDEVVFEDARYFFVDCPPLYDRDGLYGDATGTFVDNHIRYMALTQAAVQIARYIFRPDIFHAHDWQGGLLPALLKNALASDPVFMHARSVFTIHNLGYQGNFSPFITGEIGLDPVLYTPGGLEFYGQVSFMKAGIVWSDAITTVSPTYALEIQTPVHGFGMDGVLRDHAGKLTGILNGVDYSVWNPEVDRYLPAPYSSRNLWGKRLAKRALLAEMGLPSDEARPVLGIVARFAYQKGLDLVTSIGPWLAAQDAALVVLGSGDSGIEGSFLSLAAEFPDRIATRIGYNEALSHLLEAGADMFLMPSRYEPCGLNQIYSLRYGTVPIVRATGGLADTVTPDTGFLFTDFSATALEIAVADALFAFRDPSSWRRRMVLGMLQDFSWDASANAYRDLYLAHTTITEFE
jgi:starch synthase